jgi:hypothetical protein
MVWITRSVIEYEAQSALIPFVDIKIRKEMSCDNNATSFLLVSVLRQRKKANCLHFGVSTGTK